MTTTYGPVAGKTLDTPVYGGVQNVAREKANNPRTHISSLERIFQDSGLRVSVGINSHPKGWIFDLHCHGNDADLEQVIEMAKDYSQDNNNLLIEVITSKRIVIGSNATEKM